MDILDVEVFRHITMAVLDEIEVNVTRTAYSPLVYEIKDYTVGILSAEFELMAQSQLSLPGFVADLGIPVCDAVQVIGSENLEPGDVFITNYAAVQGQHINNVVSAAPIFADGEIMAYTAIRVHWSDVGGLVPGSASWDAREIYHEGTQYRGLRIMRAGKIVPEVVATALANTRMEEYVYGDMMAQLGGCVLGCRRWDERIASKWTKSEVKQLWRLQREQSAELARSRIKEIPNGVYEASMFLDDAGTVGTPPLLLKVKVIVEGTRMAIDFSGLPPQVEAPINSGITGCAMCTARIAYKILVAPDYPTDEGLFYPLEVNIPEGTIMSARKGAPMGHWNVLHTTMPELILRAIGQRCPELVPAGGHGTMAICEFAGQDKDGNRWYTTDTRSGGWGGSMYADGFSPLKTICHGDCRDIPSEILEARFPLRVVKACLIPNSAGRGMHRGGWGVERIIQVEDDAFVGTSINRTVTPPWGLAGGEPGRPGTIEMKRPDDSGWTEIRKVSMLPLPKGSLVRIRTAGGGGWGPPEKRSEAAKAEDLLSGLVVEDENGG
jgi:N-methylhydantoinase B